MFNDLKLLMQVIDFVVKACQAYAQTEQGQKELQDITDAEQAIGNSDSASNPAESAVLNSLDSARAFLAGKRK